jgi:hypothetical protein
MVRNVQELSKYLNANDSIAGSEQAEAGWTSTQPDRSR